jgi:hypothetical protein
MRLLILLCLIILIVCIFYFPLEGFEVMTRDDAITALTIPKVPLPLVDSSGNLVPVTELAKNLGSMFEALYPTFKVRPVEPDFTETKPSRVGPILKDDLRADLRSELEAEASTPMLLQGNEMLRQDR